MEKTKIKIVDYGMKMHMSMDKEHAAKYCGTIQAPGHIFNGKTFCKETVTPKRGFMEFGKPKNTFYIEGEKEDFKNIQAFLDHYNWAFELTNPSQENSPARQ